MNYSEQEKVKHTNQYFSLIEKCWADAEFKQRLIQNPNIVREHIDYDIPADMKIEILDYTNGRKKIDQNDLNPNIAYFSIPEQVDIDSLELTDEQLALVAGGAHPTLALLSASSGVCSVVAVVGGIAFGAYAVLR